MIRRAGRRAGGGLVLVVAGLAACAAPSLRLPLDQVPGELARRAQAPAGSAARLARLDLRGMDLTSLDLRGAVLRHADLRDTYLDGADLTGADLERADLERARLAGARLRGANLLDADLEAADLDGADLTDAVLQDADVRHASLIGATLTGANLRDADVQWANLSAARLERADLTDANMREIRLVDADLTGTILVDVNLKKADLQDARLDRTDLSRADVSEANLYRASLVGARLVGADLRKARLEEADLGGADLTGAVLAGAQLRGANLHGARLEGAKLAGASLEGTALTQRLPAPPRGTVRAELGVIGVSVDDAGLGGSVRTLDRSGATARQGALDGLAYGGGPLVMIGLSIGLYFPPALVLIPIGLAGGSSVGAVTGAVIEAQPAAVREAAVRVQETLAGAGLGAALRAQILTAGAALAGPRFVVMGDAGTAFRGAQPVERGTAAAVPGTVLTVAVEDVALVGPSADEPLALTMVASVRMARAGAPVPDYETRLAHLSRKRLLGEWAAADSPLLRAELDRALRALAEKIVDEVWLVRVAPAGGDPEPQTVEPVSVTPTLRWTAVAAPAGTPPAAYDLRIWRAEAGQPVELVYQRTRLVGTAHTVEEPLLPSTEYRWSVRARIEDAGGVRVSEWSAAQAPRLPVVPNPFHARFQTPPG